MRCGASFRNPRSLHGIEPALRGAIIHRIGRSSPRARIYTILTVVLRLRVSSWASMRRAARMREVLTRAKDLAA
jgi:hypothetical protein